MWCVKIPQHTCYITLWMWWFSGCCCSELNGQLIERVATEFNRLQFYVSKVRGLPLVDELKPVMNFCLLLSYS